MNTTLVVLVIVFVILCLLGIAVLFDLPLVSAFTGGGQRAQLKNLASSSRVGQVATTQDSGNTDILLKNAEQSRVDKVSSSKLTLEKRLKFAQWNISPTFFYLSELIISLAVVTVVSQNFNGLITAISLYTGPVFMNWLLNFFMDRRFKAFDADYPQFLMSLVGLLKTGMNPMTAIEAASQGLEEDSLVREEIVLMTERLKFGVTEDKSIGSFGEDIYHPEIELFVQALLLSRRVGGTLSDTLDRLAKQVRKRQYFRSSAQSAIGLQRGSIYIILAIMFGMVVYMYIVYPQGVTAALNDDLGWEIWQVGILAIVLGMYWIRQVTKIRV